MTRQLRNMMLISSLALVGWDSAAAEEVNYNGGTLTQEWKSETILQNPTWGYCAYGVNNQFIIHNSYAGKIVLYDQNGPIGTEFSTNKARVVPAFGRDEAGNWIIRLRNQQGRIDTATPEFRIISADGTQQYDITLPSSIVTVQNGNSFLFLGTIAGNLLSAEGAKLMFTGAREDGIYVMQIRNGQLIESESFDATMNTASLPETMPIKYTTESYVNAWKAADGTTHYLYVTRSDNPIDMVLNGTTLTCTALDVETQISSEVPHRGQSNGFSMFAMGGKNYMVLPCLPNWLDGFLVVQVNDDGTMVVKGYHKNDYPKQETLYQYENMSCNWLNTEPIDDHSCYIYQYFPWGYMARYIFKDDVDETTLADIVNDGEVGESYTIADDILGVYIAQMAPTKVYAKDLGKHRNPSKKSEGEIDYVKDLCKLQGSWDQSNWVLLEFDTADEAQQFAGRWNSNFDAPAAKVIKGGTLTGKLTDKLNPTMQVTSYTVPTEADEYSVNNYVTCNFMTPNVQTSTAEAHAGKKYFFIEPKAQEFVKVNWATYDGEDKFHFSLPEADGTVNAANLKGGFKVDWTLYPGDYKTDFKATKIYNFHAIVRYVAAPSQGPRRTEGDVVEGNYMVYPLEGGDNLITAIDGVSVDREVVSVTYVNLMGMQQAEPFVGINLVVTRYSDGTVKTCKLVK